MVRFGEEVGDWGRGGWFLGSREEVLGRGSGCWSGRGSSSEGLVYFFRWFRYRFY